MLFCSDLSLFCSVTTTSACLSSLYIYAPEEYLYIYAPEGCPHGTHTQVGRPTHEALVAWLTLGARGVWITPVPR